MAELLSPGIFIEERPSSVQQVTAVSTSNLATLGWSPRGPVNTATLITSLEQFFNTFGSFTKYSDVPYGVTNFFQNGGARGFFVRVVPDDAVKAAGDISTNWRFNASSEGAFGNNLRATITGNTNFYNVSGASYSKWDVNILEESSDGAGDHAVIETFDAIDLEDEDDAQYILTVMNAEFTGSDNVVTEAVSGGVPASLLSTEFLNEAVGTGDNLAQSFSVTLANPSIALETLIIKVAGSQVAVDDGEGALSGTGITGTIDYNTGELEVFFVSPPAGAAAITADYRKAGAASASVDLIGGSDGDPSSIGRTQVSASALAADKKGIYAFNEVDEFLNMGLMDFSADAAISIDLIAYAEARGDVFVILDAGEGKNAQQALKHKRQTVGSLSDYAAMYWPRIKMSDELKDGVPKTISPVCIVAGCYARTDIEKNVGKSPGGVNDGQMLGILGLSQKVTKGDRDLVYPGALNPLREDSNVGKAVWGVKTLAITGDFTRINARRLFIFLEKSTFNSTHDLVFENIGAQLFSSIKLRMDGFLSVLFEDGYFRGNSPEQAFRVVVDESNNPPEVTNARQVITDIYISVNEPGEFIRFRFQRQFPNT